MTEPTVAITPVRFQYDRLDASGSVSLFNVSLDITTVNMASAPATLGLHWLDESEFRPAHLLRHRLGEWRWWHQVLQRRGFDGVVRRLRHVLPMLPASCGPSITWRNSPRIPHLAKTAAPPVTTSPSWRDSGAERDVEMLAGSLGVALGLPALPPPPRAASARKPDSSFPKRKFELTQPDGPTIPKPGRDNAVTTTRSHRNFGARLVIGRIEAPLWLAF